MRAAPSPVSAPLWQALRIADEPQLVRQLLSATGAPEKAAHFQLRRWVRAGLIVRTPNRPRRYMMVDTDPNPPLMSGDTVKRRGPSQRQSVWTAIRVLKRFDLVELGYASQAPRGSIVSYLSVLMRAGYVRQTQSPSGRHGRLARYQVVKRSGPRAPVVSQSGSGSTLTVTLVDPNTSSRYDVSPGRNTLRGSSKHPPVDGGVG